MKRREVLQILGLSAFTPSVLGAMTFPKEEPPFILDLRLKYYNLEAHTNSGIVSWIHNGKLESVCVELEIGLPNINSYVSNFCERPDVSDDKYKTIHIVVIRNMDKQDCVGLLSVMTEKESKPPLDFKWTDDYTPIILKGPPVIDGWGYDMEGSLS